MYGGTVDAEGSVGVDAGRAFGGAFGAELPSVLAVGVGDTELVAHVAQEAFEGGELCGAVTHKVDEPSPSVLLAVFVEVWHGGTQHIGGEAAAGVAYRVELTIRSG